jgi:hypothetical protein
VPGYAAISPEIPAQLPLEARDFGMYVGFLAVWAYLVATGRGRTKGMPPWHILLSLVIFVGIMGADGINAFLYDLHDKSPVIPYLYHPLLQLRLGTGFLTGIAFAGILVPVINFSLWRGNDVRPIMVARDVLAGLVISAILYAINETHWGFFFYPLAIITSASVPILVGLINMVFVLSLFRKEGAAESWFAALNPFAAGVFFSLIELGFLSVLRYAVMGTAVLP